jgi:hypothetical protein
MSNTPNLSNPRTQFSIRRLAPALALALGPLLGTTQTAVVDAAGACTANAGQVQCTFGYTGQVQNWTVPPGVTSATFDVFGAAGGAGANSGFSSFPLGGGQGGEATVTIAVAPGATYDIYVGGPGASGASASASPGGGGGFNGGAGGGATPLALRR